MKSKRIAVGAIAVLSLISTACGTKAPSKSDDDGAGKQASAGTIAVELKEMTVTADPTSIATGSVKFTATNAGAMGHELVILKTDLAADALPVEAGKASEGGQGVEMIGKIVEFAGGETESATFDLVPGKYVLICNIAGHYQAGMRTGITAT